jgi:nucleoside-diphosphate-sugar epimerase
MRHLITGGAGFIGSHLAKYIKKCEPLSEVINHKNNQ